MVTAFAAAAGDPESSLLQYGAIGAIALLAIYAVAQLFKRLTAANEREVARADKAEEQLAALNNLVREQVIVQLTRATDVIVRATEIITERRRDGPT